MRNVPGSIRTNSHRYPLGKRHGNLRIRPQNRRVQTQEKQADSHLNASTLLGAEREGKSVNQTALDALRKQFGLDKSRRFTEDHRDLDHLFGSWDEDEFVQIQQKIESQRRIDLELWQ